jgi:hypothetical protein
VSTASKGRALEHKARHELEAAGWYVIRSAGSKGTADLVAFHASRVPAFVQCKATPGPLPPIERLALRRLALMGCGDPVHYFRSDRGVYVWRRLTDPGPADYEPWSPL